MLGYYSMFLMTTITSWSVLMFTFFLTNVPLEENIDIILNSLLIINTHVNDKQNPIKNLLAIVTEDMFHFSFKLHKRTGACPCQRFMCYHERRWVAQGPLAFKPSCTFRYVDDTFYF